jgi:hypothetical protein
MASLSNMSEPQHLAKMSSSSPADSVLSAFAALVGNFSGWTLLLATLIAIVVYDQGDLRLGTLNS